jgi:23S rRNA pseudouridine1911/1915/1917 synthase
LLREGDTIEVDPAPLAPLTATPEDIPLTVLYEDDDMVAIDKAAGMVVHAGAGVRSGTLVNALLHRFGSLSTRREICDRACAPSGRYTSGVLLVAKTDAAHRRLAGSSRGGACGRSTSSGPWGREGRTWAD